MEISVGPAHYVTMYSGNNRKKVLKSDSFIYVPIMETLKELLQICDVLCEVENFHGSQDNILRELCDGAVFMVHPTFAADNQCIQVIAYYDEVELCNPLGSSSKKHKLGCIFLALAIFILSLAQC